MVEDEPDTMFCVLIDEVESLASPRTGSSDGGGIDAKPSDTVRALNCIQKLSKV